MLQFLLIILGLVSGPAGSGSNTSNAGNDDETTTVSQSVPVDTGGDNGHIPIKK